MKISDRTLCFLTRGAPPTEVLLGFKKSGFGKGKYAGFGGSVEEGETIIAAAVRELEEETGLKVSRQHLNQDEYLVCSEHTVVDNVGEPADVQYAGRVGAPSFRFRIPLCHHRNHKALNVFVLAAPDDGRLRSCPHERPSLAGQA